MPQEIDPNLSIEAPKPRVISNDPRTALMGIPLSPIGGTTGDTSGVPSERVELPSRGLVYPANHPAKQGWIMVRPITTAEEEILATERFAKMGTTIDMILSRCIVTRGINTLDLVSGDRTHLLFYLRAISYGPEYSFVATLRGGVQQEVKTNVAKLQIKTLPDNFMEPVTIQIEGDIYEVVLLRGRDEQAITQERLALKRKNPDAADPGASSTLSRQIKSINGDQDVDNILKHVRSMIGRKASILRREILKISPGPVLKQTVTNRETGEQEEVIIQVTESFFRAEDESSGAMGE
jgi:hypothetical protein